MKRRYEFSARATEDIKYVLYTYKMIYVNSAKMKWVSEDERTRETKKKKQTPKRAKNMNVYDKLKNIETVVIVPKPRVQTMNAWNEDNTHFIIWFIRITFQCLCLPFRYLSAVLKWQIDIKLYQWLFRYCDRKYQHTVKFLTSECKH